MKKAKKKSGGTCHKHGCDMVYQMFRTLFFPTPHLASVYCCFAVWSGKQTKARRGLSCLIIHSQSPNNGILKNNCYNTPTSTSQYFLVLGPPEVRRPQYEKILASRGQEASIRENIG